MNNFLLLPILVRAAVILAIPLLLWFVLGRALIWCLSLIPFLLRQIFRFIYMILEIPVAVLHKKMGGSFYKIDNAFSQKGEKIDTKLCAWYNAWHNSSKRYRRIAAIIYVICVAFIGIPPLLRVNVPFLDSVETAYFSCEDSLVKWVEERGWFDADVETALVEESEKIEESSVIQNQEIVLKVSGVKTSLKVRDLPTMETDVVVDRIHKGDKIIWNGQLAFSKNKDGVVELWAKIITPSGIEGWSRMSYLLPEEYKNLEFYVTQQENKD